MQKIVGEYAPKRYKKLIWKTRFKFSMWGPLAYVFEHLNYVGAILFYTYLDLMCDNTVILYFVQYPL